MNPRITRPRAAIAGGTAVALAAAAVGVSLSLSHGGSTASPATAGKTHKAQLSSSSCTGPAGAAYIATAGYQAFDAVDTNNCYEVQQYNVGDPAVPGTGTSDTNYSSTDEGVAMYGNTLYFADTGNDTVAVVPSQSLNPDDYVDTPETLIRVGVNPEGVAVSPDGSQVWVADTGPQTGEPTLGALSVISAATNTVTATIPLRGTDPRQIAFSPSGGTAYVTTGIGLYVINTATHRIVTVIGGLGNPEGVTVAPNGTVYVTNDVKNVVDVISPAANRVTAAIAVGQLPWQMTLTSDGGTLYVADGDSDAISVINTATNTVKNTISVSGGPVSVALTPDGSRLWVGGLTSGNVSVIDTSDDTIVGSFAVGYGEYPNSGDGEEPTGIVMTSTLTPGA
jgi:YVTN family beta-propeller protein